MEKSKERVFNDATIIVLGHMKHALDKALASDAITEPTKQRIQRRYDISVQALNEHANLTRGKLIEMGEEDPDADAMVMLPMVFYGAVSDIIFGPGSPRNGTPV